MKVFLIRDKWDKVHFKIQLFIKVLVYLSYVFYVNLKIRNCFIVKVTSLVCVNPCSNKLLYKPGEIPVPSLTALSLRTSQTCLHK